MKDSGWIKLHRQIQDCWIWFDEPFTKAQAWIDLLLLANHREKKISINGKPVLIQRGQYHTSVCKLSSRWKWNRKTVSRFLDVLENDQMLSQERTTHGTTITIENYDVFQDCGTADGTADGTTVYTADGTTDGTQTRKKELKKEKKNIYGEFKHVKLTDSEYQRLTDDFGEVKRDKAIAKLDEYIEEKPSYKSQNHNLCIRRWVIKAVEEADVRPIKKSKTTFQNMDMKHQYDYEEMERQLLNG